MKNESLVLSVPLDNSDFRHIGLKAELDLPDGFYTIENCHFCNSRVKMPRRKQFLSEIKPETKLLPCCPECLAKEAPDDWKTICKSINKAKDLLANTDKLLEALTPKPHTVVWGHEITECFAGKPGAPLFDAIGDKLEKVHALLGCGGNNIGVDLAGGLCTAMEHYSRLRDIPPALALVAMAMLMEAIWDGTEGHRPDSIEPADVKTFLEKIGYEIEHCAKYPAS